MQVVPKFTIHKNQNEDEGVFEWGQSRNSLFEAYNNAADHYFMAEIEEAQKKLGDIIDEDPYFIDAFNMLGTIEQELGNPEEAEKYWEKAYHAGSKLIPESFDGKIRWGFTENRPYLRAMHQMAITHLTGNNPEKAIQLLEQILAYNPDDNQGIRYSIGDLYFLQSKYKKAQAVYEENLDYPPYLYSHGLLHLILGNKVKAITYFRKGILANIYISDALRMNFPLIPYDIWHQSNFEMPETAHDYTSMMMEKWISMPESFELLQFLHISELFGPAIQDVYALKEELKYIDELDEIEESRAARREIISDIETIQNGITDSSSKKILKRWEKAPQASLFN